jgi:hypothetical protein
VFSSKLDGIAAQRCSQRRSGYFSGGSQVRHGNKDVSRTARFLRASVFRRTKIG